MESFFIAQLIGLYLLIVGVVVAVRRTSIMPAIAELSKNRGILVGFAFVELAAGIAVILVYPRIVLDWTGIISLVGWMMLVESLFYLAMPFRYMKKLIKAFNHPRWYVIGGIVAALSGAYLTAIGFRVI